MSERTNRQLKTPALASSRTARSPLTPRVAGNASTSPTITAARPAAPKVPSSRTSVVSPRLRLTDDGLSKDAIAGSPGVTPRSSMRRQKVDNASDDLPVEVKPKSLPSGSDSLGRNSAVSGMSAASGSSGVTGRPRISRPKSAFSDNAPRSPPLVRPPGFVDSGQTAAKDSIDSRFFHASEVQRQEPVPKKVEPKKTPTFFYANGTEDKPADPLRPPSPVLSSVSEKVTLGASWLNADGSLNISKSPAMLSPSLASATGGASSFFAPAVSGQDLLRSPSPSKENIHLSYRKGASQIFGMRPTQQSSASSTSPPLQTVVETRRRPSFGPHRKSPSLSSIDSGNSYQSRRRSATAIDAVPVASPLVQEVQPPPVPRVTSPSIDLPSIDTSLVLSTSVDSPPQNPLSPTKSSSELAAEARRERKVLDLEISNSSLLAINASLEREVRRQKAELKRFRRLSRAGRLSTSTNEPPRRQSGDLDPVGEDEDDDADEIEYEPLHRGPGLAGEDDLSDSEEDSLVSGGEPLSAEAQANKQQDRLAKDEKRLRVDLERHKELLTQSQAMNQSLKRCMFATEEMIREGRKALEYHVRVSDVKLGGRILTGHEDEDMIEVEDDATTDNDDGDANDMESAKGLLDVWRGVGSAVLDGSEGSGDRDSGIEVDKAFAVTGRTSTATTSSNPPPDDGLSARPAHASDSITAPEADHSGTTTTTTTSLMRDYVS